VYALEDEPALADARDAQFGVNVGDLLDAVGQEYGFGQRRRQSRHDGLRPTRSE